MVLCQHLNISSYIRITLLGPGYQEKGRGADISQWPFSTKQTPIWLTPSPLTSLVFSLEPIFLKISAKKSFTLAFDDFSSCN